MKLDDRFTDLDLALSTYRHTVSSLLPRMTRVAWNLKKDDLQKVLVIIKGDEVEIRIKDKVETDPENR